jgi:PcfJ-like protein
MSQATSKLALHLNRLKIYKLRVKIMKHVSYGLLGSILTPQNGSKILHLLPSLTVSPQNTREAYRVAQENNSIEILEELAKDYTIRAEFKFLGDFFDKCVESRSYFLLPMPVFSTTGEDFKGVIEKLALGNVTRNVIKKFGFLTQKHGVHFLNNFYYLKHLLCENAYSTQEYLNLDHSLPLKGAVIFGFSNSEIILNHYSLSKLMKLLVSASEREVHDTNFMISNHPQSEELIDLLPRKPKSFKEIHDAISTGIRKKHQPNSPLDQQLVHIHGKHINGYEIEVPKNAQGLINTSEELSHCVHSYTSRIRNRKCQIINLKKDGKRVYTIELVRSGDSFEKQFKGFKNERSMEGPDGESMRNEIIKACSLYLKST